MIGSVQRMPVDSSSLRSVGYLESEGVLEAEFRDGALYRYFGVGPALWSRLLTAESKGAFFNQHVRTAYSSVQIKVSAPDTLHADLEASLASMRRAGRAS